MEYPTIGTTVIDIGTIKPSLIHFNVETIALRATDGRRCLFREAYRLF